MTRKKNQNIETTGTETDATTPAAGEQQARNVEPQRSAAEQAAALVDFLTDPANDQSSASPKPKNWGPPYKAIFVCKAKGFELGEDRLYRKRVFFFAEKPDPGVIQILKENGLSYRPSDRAWIIQADAGTRVITDRLAKQFAGESQEINP